MNSGDAGTLEVPQLRVPMSHEAPAISSVSPPPSTPQLKPRSSQEIAKAQQAKRRITLNVGVRDSTGRPLNGLGEQDLTILDNSRKQTISSFHEVDGDTAQPPPELILLLDTVNASPETVGIERQGVEKFLRSANGQLPLPVSIIHFWDTGIELSRPSRDGNALAQDLKKLGTSMRVNTVATGFEGLQQRFQSSTRALKEITRYEATKPGRKLLVWIGPGWPLLTPGVFKSDTKAKTAFFNNIVDLNTALRQADITLYSVPLLDMSQGTELHTFVYQDFLKEVDSPKEAESGNLAVQVLAIQSGGIAFDPHGDISALISKCIDDARHWYELSFDSAPAKTPDELHQLEIGVDKPKLTVRTSTGYYAQP